MSDSHGRHYVILWIWLLVLVVVSVAAASILPKQQALVLIFAVAIVKALLVARNYMHLKNERAIIYAMVFIPLAFVAILLIALFPDFVFRG
jgi:caa(3)-type oxidase subunit IV